MLCQYRLRRSLRKCLVSAALFYPCVFSYVSKRRAVFVDFPVLAKLRFIHELEYSYMS